MRGDGREPCAWWITTNRGPAWAWIDPASLFHVQLEACGPVLYALSRYVVTHFAFRGSARAALASLVEDIERAGVLVLDVEAPVPMDAITFDWWSV